MYSNSTVHYEIPLPQANDAFNPMDWNESSEKLDTAVFNASQVATVTRDDLSTAKEDIKNLQNGLNETNDKATALTARVSVLEQNDATYADGIKDLGDMVTAREVTQAQSNIEIAVGKWFRYNGVLYVCTAEIKAGDTIVPNVNCRATNIESEMPTDSSEIVDRIEALEAKDKLVDKTIGSTSISGIGDGSVTGAISELEAQHVEMNENITQINTDLSMLKSFDYTVIDMPITVANVVTFSQEFPEGFTRDNTFVVSEMIVTDEESKGRLNSDTSWSIGVNGFYYYTTNSAAIGQTIRLYVAK